MAQPVLASTYVPSTVVPVRRLPRRESIAQWWCFICPMAEDGQILFFTVAVKDLACLIPILSKGHAPHVSSFCLSYTVCKW